MALGRRRRWSAAGVFLLIGIAPAQGRADESAPPAVTVRVEYRAAPSCPSRAEFIDNVRRYTTKWSLVDDGASRELGIVLDRSVDAVRGTLEISVGGRKSRKVVSAASCASVARALAVMVALVIDPSASLTARREDSPPPGSDSSPPAPSPPAPTPEDPPSAEESPATKMARPEQAERAAPRRPSTSSRRRTTRVHAVPSPPRWMFELRSEVSSAVTRLPIGVIAGFVDLQVPVFVPHDERSSVMGPSSIGIGLRQSVPRAIGVPGGSTEFLWSAASMRICPLRLRLLGDRVEVAPCVEGNLGMIQAESHGLPFALQTRKHWLDGGASVLGVWRLPGPWVATAGAGLVAPLTRHRFEVVDLASVGAASGPRSELVSQAPMLGIAVGVGLGLQL